MRADIKNRFDNLDTKIGKLRLELQSLRNEILYEVRQFNGGQTKRTDELVNRVIEMSLIVQGHPAEATTHRRYQGMEKETEVETPDIDDDNDGWNGPLDGRESITMP